MGGLHRFYWRYLFFAIASGWLARSQWVTYVDFIGIICYSQWVVCTVPLTLCVLSFVVLIFPVLDCSVWAALGMKRAAPKVCVFSCWDKLKFRGE